MTAGAARPFDSSFADQAFAATADAYTRAPDGWEHAVHAAIAGLFDFLASHAAQTKACIVADCGASPDALAGRDRTIERFVELLQPGVGAVATPPPPVVAEAIGGGIYELVRGHVLELRLEELRDAIPDATIVALSPFIGASGAIELVGSKNVQAGR
jgi:hypothetical protein